MDKKQQIDELLKDKSYLISELLYERDIDFIKAILKM